MRGRAGGSERRRNMGKGYWVIRTYKSGQVGEKIKYWVPGERPTKSQRRMKAEIRKQQQNEASAVKRMARLLNANYTKEDCLIGLEYSDAGLRKLEVWQDGEPDQEGEDRIFHAAHHQLRLFLKRLRRACREAGVPMLTIAITSDMDGETGESVRPHHHIVINRAAAELAMEKWSLGGFDCKHLYDTADQTALADYLLKQVRRLPDEKKYIPSRGLVTPQPVDRIALGGAELVVPRGGQLLQRNEYRPGMPQYIRYILPEVGQIRRGRNKKE